MKPINVMAQYRAWPYLTRRLTFNIADVDFAVAAYRHLKSEVGREYSRVWFYRG